MVLRDLLKAPVWFVVVTLASGLTACDGSRQAAVVAPTPVQSMMPSVQRVDGYVRDMGSQPLEGARVEVLDGAQANASAITDASGAFSITGIFNDTVRFRATKPGHIPMVQASQSQQCLNCPRRIDFVLETVGPPVEIAGHYDLTFVADPSCTGIPEEVRQRKYRATAARDQILERLELRVLDPSVLHDYEWEGIFIHSTGNYLVMGVGNVHGSPGLVERTAPDTYISFDGGAEGIARALETPTMAAAFEGVVEYCQLRTGSPSPVAAGGYSCAAAEAIARVQCASTRHRFILSRR